MKRLTNTPHIRAIESGLNEMACDPSLTLADVRVWLFIVGNMEFENIFSMTQLAMAKRMLVPRQTVSRGVKTLIEKGYLRIIGAIGKQNVYAVNPYYAFKSRASKYDEMCQTWDRETELLEIKKETKTKVLEAKASSLKTLNPRVAM